MWPSRVRVKVRIRVRVGVRVSLIVSLQEKDIVVIGIDIKNPGDPSLHPYL